MKKLNKIERETYTEAVMQKEKNNLNVTHIKKAATS